jgi:prepilin-type N-terminal cleavage/methylation domain-containing protein
VRTKALGRHSGFTLLETIVAAALLSVLAAFATMKIITAATLTLPVQAQSAADHIRRAQTQAMACKQRMNVTLPTSSSIAVASVGSPACLPSATLTLSQGVTVSGSSMSFNTLGQPLGAGGSPLASAAVFTLSFTSSGRTQSSIVTVDALTGRVSVSN